ncbi:DUF6286 domain-containing protein [Streptomyces sp. NPDC047002]|uniref:DUF6286 domain-containing protein n=1 Tax=Streptomyces sp. NPDC047002 TaxID=3155475 RepID=UPI0034516FAD
MLGALGCAAVLYDVAAVRLGARPAPWRHALLDRVYGLSLTAVVAAVAAVALVLLGLWLVWLAVTPGARRLTPMEPPSADVRAYLDRSAVALLLRDTALEIPGVGAVRVKVRRRKVFVGATVRFGDPDEFREALSSAVTAKRDRLGLAKPPRLTVFVRPDEEWTPPPADAPSGLPRAPRQKQSPPQKQGVDAPVAPAAGEK